MSDRATPVQSTITCPESRVAPAKAVITISRTDETDVRQRQIIARVDDERPATLLFGDASTWEVEPGAHRVRAHNTLIRKTVSFEAKPGEHVEFVVINRSGSMTFGFLALLGAAPLYLTVERRETAPSVPVAEHA